MYATVEWGTVPDWIAAIGTAGALFAAVVLLWLDLSRRREEIEEARRAQAALIAGWLIGPNTNQMTGPQADRSYDVQVVNRSDLPIYSCLLRLEWEGDPAAHHLGIGVVAPGADLVAVLGIHDSQKAISGFPIFSLGFTDAGGQPWRKYGDGRLDQGYWPAATPASVTGRQE